MSLRSRALLAGFAGGFVREENRKIDQRTNDARKAFSDNAMMRREQAKSEYAKNKAAQEAETARKLELLNGGAIGTEADAQGRHAYTPAHWNNEARKQWVAEGGKPKDYYEFISKNPNYVDKFSHGKGKYFISQYEDSQFITDKFNERMTTISTAEQEGLGQRQLTSLGSALTGDSVEEQEARNAEILSRGGESTSGLREDVGEQEFNGGDSFRPVGITEETKSLWKFETVKDAVDSEGNPIGNVSIVSETPSGHEKMIGRRVSVGVDENNNTLLTPVDVFDPDVVGSGSGSRLVSFGQSKADVNPTVVAKYRDSTSAINSVQNIGELMTVETESQLIGVAAFANSLFGTEYNALRGNPEAQHSYKKDRIEDVVSIWSKDDDSVDNDTSTLSEISAAVGALNQEKRTLAYALVRLQRDSGRFNGQELKEQLELLNTSNMASALGTLQRAKSQAVSRVKTAITDMAADSIVTRLGIQGTQVPRSEALGWFGKTPKQAPNGSWFIPMNSPKHPDRPYAIISPVGGISFPSNKE